VLDDAGIPFGLQEVNPWLVLRTYPIRIAGNSGGLPCEISWEALQARHGSHIPVEQTTVTKKVRRVGEFDYDLAREALWRIRPSRVVVTFVDYLFPDIKKTGVDARVRHWLNGLEDGLGRPVHHLGIGIGELISAH